MESTTPNTLNKSPQPIGMLNDLKICNILDKQVGKIRNI